MAGKPPRGRKNHQPMSWSCCRMCRCHQCPNGLWVCSVAKLLNHSPTVQAYCHKLRGLALFPSYIHQCQSTWCVLLTAPAQPPGTAGSSHCPGTATTPPPPRPSPCLLLYSLCKVAATAWQQNPWLRMSCMPPRQAAAT